MKVKVLGIVGLVDEGKYKLECYMKYRIIYKNIYKKKYFSGETDWKIIVIDVNDPLADQMNGK